MCGICGIIYSDPQRSVDNELLKSMNRALVHRGPDDEGYFIGGAAGLAMRRLSIIDLSTGKQPITNEDDSVWIVFNGEIYNYLELRKDLKLRGHVLKTQSDTEVIVHLYEDYGPECVNHLNGMFAFAIWDTRQKSLLLARDRFGIKPLFYSCQNGDGILFGSEIKALIAGGASRSPDFQAIYDYLSLMYVPTPSTAFEHIKALAPGHIAIWKNGEISTQRYWDLPLPASGQEIPYNSKIEDEILHKLEASIRGQMIADVQVGALLSGGLDSTTVAAVMKTRLNSNLKAFTIGFEHKSYDESEDARLVADTLGCEQILVQAAPGMVGSMEDLLGQFDEPFADYSAIPTYLISKTAASHLKVVLTGDGGDEVFAGYPTHVAHKASRIYNLLPLIVRTKLIEPLVKSLPTSFERISLDYKAKRFVSAASLPFGKAHYSWKVIFDEVSKGDLCSPEFLTHCRTGTYERVFEPHFKRSMACHPINRLLYVDTKTFLVNDNLTKVDRMTMANSLEARVPFLDHELVEMVAMVDPRAKTKGFETKSILRKIAAQILPRKISKGRKRGFTPPLPFWIRDGLRIFIEESLSRSRISASGILDPSYCDKLVQEHLAGVKDNNREIWALVSLIHWAEKWKVSV